MNRLKNLIKNRICAIANISVIPRTLLKYLNKEQPINIVDIGAYDGSFTDAIASHCGISKGILIEPIPHKAAKLRQLFPAPKYQVFECAVSANNERVEFEINESEVTSSILPIRREMSELSALKLDNWKKFKCYTRTLDDIVAESQIDHIDLLKIDVQGAEHLVLKGGQQAIEQTSMIWIEVSFKALYESSSIFSDIYSLLNNAGFKLMELEPGFRSPDGELLQGDALFRKM
jgi:FkbM family methyltransferase